MASCYVTSSTTGLISSAACPVTRTDTYNYCAVISNKKRKTFLIRLFKYLYVQMSHHYIFVDWGVDNRERGLFDRICVCSELWLWFTVVNFNRFGVQSACMLFHKRLQYKFGLVYTHCHVRKWCDLVAQIYELTNSEHTIRVVVFDFIFLSIKTARTQNSLFSQKRK